MRYDEDLASLHDDARFQALILKLEAESKEHESHEGQHKYKVKSKIKEMLERSDRDNES